MDPRGEAVMDFEYRTPEGRSTMRWRRANEWKRQSMRRGKAGQPVRHVYLRTLSNLGNPSEMHGILGMTRSKTLPDEKRLTISEIEFAQRILPFRYSEVVDLSRGRRNLLFATREGAHDTTYSELHMSAGERAIFRLSKEIAQTEGALILIDEVEAGLHPWVQQLLMLHLQQLALRNNFQIIVTTHSPVVLDSVPPNGRIFLERDDSGQVAISPPYRDIIQNAFYGRSREALNLLCEDETAEDVLDGVFDVLLPRSNARRDSVRIGRNTGADEFPTHAKAFLKFGQLDNFIFILDGDKIGSGAETKLRDLENGKVQLLFLPGSDGPEAWIWDVLRSYSEDRSPEARQLSFASLSALATEMGKLDSVYNSASDKTAEIAKSKLNELAEFFDTTTHGIAREVARLETERKESAIQPLVEDLQDRLERWRSRDLYP